LAKIKTTQSVKVIPNQYKAQLWCHNHNVIIKAIASKPGPNPPCYIEILHNGQSDISTRTYSQPVELNEKMWELMVYFYEKNNPKP
jgi:hypothetical protein